MDFAKKLAELEAEQAQLTKDLAEAKKAGDKDVVLKLYDVIKANQEAQTAVIGRIDRTEAGDKEVDVLKLYDLIKANQEAQTAVIGRIDRTLDWPFGATAFPYANAVIFADMQLHQLGNSLLLLVLGLGVLLVVRRLFRRLHELQLALIMSGTHDPYDEISASSADRQSTMANILRQNKCWTGKCVVLGVLGKSPPNVMGAHIVPHSIAKHWAKYQDQLTLKSAGDLDSPRNLLPMEKTLEELMEQRKWTFVPRSNSSGNTFVVKVLSGGTCPVNVGGTTKNPITMPLQTLHGTEVTMPDHVSRTCLYFHAFYVHKFHGELPSLLSLQTGFTKPGSDSPPRDVVKLMASQK